jgi:four helix bundle protein
MLGVKRVEDLEIYQLTVRLRREVIRLTSTGPVTRDYKFVAQIRDSARGGPRTISEGFSRLAPLEFHRYLSYTKGSLEETKNHVLDGHESGYFSDEDHRRLVKLAERALGGTTRLMIYLDSSEAQLAYEEIRQRRREWQPKNTASRRRKDSE